MANTGVRGQEVFKGKAEDQKAAKINVGETALKKQQERQQSYLIPTPQILPAWVQNYAVIILYTSFITYYALGFI